MSTDLDAKPALADDSQLLERFISDRSADAFAELIRRHLPAVHAHARRALHDPSSAEDVAQAVFLLLARKPPTLAPHQPLAGWLHKVTHYTCMNARKRDARRKHHEQEASRMSAHSPNASTLDAEVASHLDAVLQQLPAPQRDILLLRFVHDLPFADIARLTSISEEAAKKRLHRALHHLRTRLHAAGLRVPALFSPAPLLAAAPLPAHLAPLTLTTALSPHAAPAILHLAQGASHVLLAAKLKIVSAAAMIVAVLSAGTAILLAQRLPTPPPLPIAAATPASLPIPEIASPVAPSTAPDELLTVHGQILDPAGKPFPDATISIPAPHQWNQPPAPPVAVTHSGLDGRYSITFHKADVSPFSDGTGSARADAWKETQIVANASTLGMAWATWNHTDAAGDVNLQLVPDDFPIDATILAADGKPAANTLVTVSSLSDYTDKTWEDAYQQGEEALNKLPEGLRDPFATSAPLLTDAAGHLRITGLGHNRWATLRLHGPSAALSTVEVLTQNAPPHVRTYKVSGTRDVPTINVYGNTFTITAGPAFSVDGTLRDAITHAPIPNATVMGQYVTETHQNLAQLSTISGPDGHYHLDGIPTGGKRNLIVFPAEDQPYLMRQAIIPDRHTPQQIFLDFELHKGVWITGRVADKITGAPVSARLEYTAYLDNPHTLDLPEFTRHVGGGEMDGDQARYETKPDGSYRVVAVPGKGVLGIVCWGGRHYRIGVGADKTAAYSEPGTNQPGLALYQHYPMREFDNVITDVDVPETGPGPVLNFQLDPGATVHATILDPAGKPVTGCWVEHAAIAGNGNDGIGPLATNTFDITGLSPDESRSLVIANLSRKLGVIVPFTLADARDNAFTVTLQPLAEITGRCLDPTGKPSGDVIITVSTRESDNAGIATTDAEGRFHCLIVPGTELYEAHVDRGPYFGSPIARSLTIAAGETQDLGDIHLKRARR